MAMDARTMASLYTKLVPVLGEDDANAFMSQFRVMPPGEPDEVVTTRVLHAETDQLRYEIATLREEVQRLGGRT